MTEKPEASVLTARRAAQHFRLSSADDACEHLYILIVRSSLGPSPPNAGRYTVASRFRRRSCERGYIFPRAPEQFVTSPLCLVGYVRWDARSDRVPPLQTIIFSSFPGRTPVIRLGSWQREKRLWPVACGGRVPSLDDFGPQPGPPAVTNSGLVQRLIQCHYYVQRLIRLSPAHVVLADNGELQPRHLVRRVRTRRIDTARTCGGMAASIRR